MGISASAAITFGLLTLSLIALWIPKRSFYNLYKGLDLWVLLFIFSLGFGLSANFVHVVALIPIIVLGVSCKFLGDKSYKRLARSISPILILVISVGMIAHLIPGFSNPIIISNLVITEGAIPFTLYLNFDKSLVGLFILGFCHKRLSSKNDWLNMAKNIYLQILLLILVVMVTSLAIKYVQVEIKFPPSFPVWAWVNLLFVCTAEEAFFRGFLQKSLVNYFKEVKYGSLGGILLASLLFGFAHYAGGINLIFLATIAGLGYGWIYYSNRTIESAILAHFSLNVIHFIFFTYPALA
jgi:hypothetical protein